MSIDNVKYRSPAQKGDVSGTTITTCVALYAIASALDAIRTGDKPTVKQIETIRTSAERLDKIFDQLTGFQL